METTLRMFYARALFATCFFFLVFLVAFAGVALAQEAGPITVDQIAAPADDALSIPIVEPAKDWIDVAFATLTAGVVGVVGWLLARIGAVVLPYIPQWVVATIDRVTTAEAKDWEFVVKESMERAEAAARSKFDAVKQRHQYLDHIADVLRLLNPEVFSWADRDKNGVPDFIETWLASKGLSKGPTLPPVASIAQRRRGVEAVQ